VFSIISKRLFCAILLLPMREIPRLLSYRNIHIYVNTYNYI
jgi:hypothetical protein